MANNYVLEKRVLHAKEFPRLRALVCQISNSNTPQAPRTPYNVSPQEPKRGLLAAPVNVAAGTAVTGVSAEERLAVASAVVRSRPLPFAVVALVVLGSAVLLAVADAGSSLVTCEDKLELLEDLLVELAFTVCSLVGAPEVVVGMKVGVSSDIDNGHMLDVPDAEAIEIVASGM